MTNCTGNAWAGSFLNDTALSAIGVEMPIWMDVAAHPDKLMAILMAEGTLKNQIETGPADYLIKYINNGIKENDLEGYGISGLVKELNSQTSSNSFARISGLTYEEMVDLAEQLRRLHNEFSK